MNIHPLYTRQESTDDGVGFTVCAYAVVLLAALVEL